MKLFQRSTSSTEAEPDDEAAIPLGRYWDETTGRAGDKLFYRNKTSIVVIGPNQCGKDARLVTPFLLANKKNSVWIFDPRGTTAAITYRERAKLGPCYVHNPFGVNLEIPGYEYLASNGCGLLSSLDPGVPMFVDESVACATATIKLNNDSQPHFPESARAPWAGLTMDEVIAAKREGRTPTLANVRDALTAPEEQLREHARRIVAEGTPAMASLMGRFASEKWSDGTHDILGTADTQTRWLLSPPMRDDMAKEVNFDELGERVCTHYVILPPQLIETHSMWVRLMLSGALRSMYRARPGGVRCTFVLNEFYSLGHVEEVAAVMGLTAGYNCQLMIIVQSLSMLRHLYKDNFETFLSQAGAVVGFAPNNDTFTADWMSKRSGEYTYKTPTSNENNNPSGGVGTGRGEAYSRRPYLTPADLFDLPKGHVYIWAKGLSKPIHAVLTNWYDDPDLAARGDDDPFYPRRKRRSATPAKQERKNIMNGFFGEKSAPASSALGSEVAQLQTKLGAAVALVAVRDKELAALHAEHVAEVADLNEHLEELAGVASISVELDDKVKALEPELLQLKEQNAKLTAALLRLKENPPAAVETDIKKSAEQVWKICSKYLTPDEVKPGDSALDAMKRAHAAIRAEVLSIKKGRNG